MREMKSQRELMKGCCSRCNQSLVEHTRWCFDIVCRRRFYLFRDDGATDVNSAYDVVLTLLQDEQYHGTAEFDQALAQVKVGHADADKKPELHATT